MKRKRFTYTLVPTARAVWRLYAPGGALVAFFLADRRSAIKQAGARLESFAAFDQLSELRVERKSGGYAKETRTYPRKSDPKRTRG